MKATMPAQRIPPTTPSSQCEPITSLLPTCANVGWQNATFPNLLGHANQEEAYDELKDFDRLIETKCSNKLVHFLCALYAPVCISNSGEYSSDGTITMQPCRSLCEEVSADCGPSLANMSYDYEWLKDFTCERFPSECESACVNVPDNVPMPDMLGLNLSVPSVATSAPNAGTCQPISSCNAICINVGWSHTTLPNLRGHSTLKEAYAELDDFIPLIEYQCSNKLVHLLCAVYAPICFQNGTFQKDPAYPPEITVLKPCKELCEYVRPRCEPVMKSANHSWPEHLDCDNFPSKSPGVVCVDAPDNVTIPDIRGLNFSDMPTMLYINTSSPNTNNIPEGSNETLSTAQPTHSTATCGPITDAIPICTNVGWTHVNFPNLRGHGTQEEAYQELVNFIPLIEEQCSNKLVHLLCAVYAPECVHSNSQNDSSFTVLEPCNQLCEDVHTNCEPFLESHNNLWLLDCNNFPKTTGECFNVPDNVTTPDIPGLDLSTRPTSTSTHGLSGSGTSISTSDTTNTDQPTTTDISTTCQAINSSASTCSNIGWHSACLPNIRGHATQEEAMAELRDFAPLIEEQCSSKMVYLLCAIYMPQCYFNEQCLGDFGPCTELCEEVHSDCKSVIESDVTWSSILDCSNYVSIATGQCIGAPNISEATSTMIDGEEVIAADPSSASPLVPIGLISFFLSFLAFSSTTV